MTTIDDQVLEWPPEVGHPVLFAVVPALVAVVVVAVCSTALVLGLVQMAGWLS